jgi:hypothetical protein
MRLLPLDKLVAECYKKAVALFIWVHKKFGKRYMAFDMMQWLKKLLFLYQLKQLYPQA